MAGEKLRIVIDALRQYLFQQQWSIVSEKEVQNGYQFIVTDGATRVPVICYHNGNVLIQGPPGEVKTALQTWKNQGKADQKPTPQAPSSLWETAEFSTEQNIQKETVASTASTAVKTATIAHIGTDEAGKGDYFGPLVVAGVYVTEETASQLLALGVRDSKQLSDTRIASLAAEIKAVCRGSGSVLVYRPEHYNQLYQQILNLNQLLAKAHAKIIANLQKSTACTLAVIDQFGDALLVPAALREIGCQIAIEQRPRAEDDIAVAAASIVARAAFVQQIEELSEKMSLSLPKGASDPKIVTVGREIVAKHGQEALGKVAKLHFKTTQLILQDRE
jgi:ribonuclease HIII